MNERSDTNWRLDTTIPKYAWVVAGMLLVAIVVLTLTILVR